MDLLQNKRFFRPDEVAAILALSRRTVYRMMRDGASQRREVGLRPLAHPPGEPDGPGLPGKRPRLLSPQPFRPSQALISGRLRTPSRAGRLPAAPLNRKITLHFSSRTLKYEEEIYYLHQEG